MTNGTLTYMAGGESFKFSANFADPQDALNFVWSEAEKAPEDAFGLFATVNGLEIEL